MPWITVYNFGTRRQKKHSVYAGVAQLVEHDVANVVVVGSNPITRSLPAHGNSRNIPVNN